MTLLDIDQRRWLRVRGHLNRHRGELTRVATARYPGVPKLGASQLLTRRGWVPDKPIPLDRVALRWRKQPERTWVTEDLEKASAGVRPLRTERERFASYSTTIQALDRPRVFDDRPSYRLLTAQPTGDAVCLEFTAGRYFEAVDVGEACAHELAGAQLDGTDLLPLRSYVGDPTLIADRPALLGVSVLTVRVDAPTGEAAFLLHLRDPDKVTTGGGQQHVVPVGLFQPPPGRPAAPDGHFDLWRLITREYAEELLGYPEDPDDGEAAAFHAAMDAARAAGRCRPYHLGLGVDPLMLATDVLTAVVFDGETFDGLFSGLAETNSEGALARHGSGVWFPLTATDVERVAGARETQPAGAAALILAWQGRETLGVVG